MNSGKNIAVSQSSFSTCGQHLLNKQLPWCCRNGCYLPRLCDIEGNLYKTIQQFLPNRTQKVVVDDKQSWPMRFFSRTLQETVLGPIIFLIYINDIWFIRGSKISNFADNTRISRKITSLDDIDFRFLQDYLNRIIEWSLENNMELHEDNFELLSYRISANNNNMISDALPFMNDLAKRAVTKNMSPSKGEGFAKSDTWWQLGLLKKWHHP